MKNNSLINEGNNPPKLTYLNDLWMYIDEIKNRFTVNRNKLGSLLDIFTEKNKMEEQYAKELKKLTNDFITKYNNKEDITTCDHTIMKLVDMLKEESNLMEEKNKFENENIIKTLKGFLEIQISCSNEFLKLTDSSQADFKLINELLRHKEDNLMKVGKKFELSLYKLEREKLNLEKNKENNKIMEKDDKSNEIKNKGNEGDNKDNNKGKDKDTEDFKKIKSKARASLFEYENFIIVANKEREKFIDLSTQMYNHIQKFDENFIDTIKVRFKMLLEKEIFYMNKYINIKNNILNNYINLINVQEDINTFINSKIMKFKIPSEIECIYYYPQVVLRTRNDPNESKITEKVNEQLTKLFLKNKKKEEGKEDIYAFMQNSMKLMLEEKEYEKEKLLKLVEKKEGRFYFFEALNQYRIEGIFNLPQKTFDELSFILSHLIKFTIKDEDYESFKSLIILSQTFYLNTNKNKFLHSSINDNQIWKDKLFWEKVIDYSINEELNNPRTFYLFLGEKKKNKEERITSSIKSNIFTFIFNMKLFNYPKEKYKELIDDLIKKYKIDDNSIQESLNSINEIENEKIEEKEEKEEKNNNQERIENDDEIKNKGKKEENENNKNNN